MTAGGDELPDDLADLAAAQLLAAVGPERTAVLAALLAAHPRHERDLRQLAADLGGAERLLADTFPEAGAAAGSRLGGHRVVRLLGEGAFGTVYLCAQEHPVVREVAVKVLRRGAGDERTLRRFLAERQLLAALNHPAITQVFDAGVLADGRPFFVMEYVGGLPLRRYCEERALPGRERLRLFVDVCRGVAHAHRRGIVHRDLKPANVLVVDTDRGPQPKIIDFGIAKALFPSADGEGPRTDPGRVIGTPGYMSPEQAEGRTAEVDQRADVWALGAMLYELLTGTLPSPPAGGAPDTAPVRPSARLAAATKGAAPEQAAQVRQRAAELRGDLDWITLKALRRERGERYPSACELADDLERHLRSEPVAAGPPSFAYRARKFARRHRAAVLVAGGAAVALAVGVAVLLRVVWNAEATVAAARQEASSSLADATAVLDRLLARANDERLREAPRGDATRQELLQDALTFYERFLGHRPADAALRAGRVRALASISHVHWLLGEAAQAASTAAEAVADAEALVAAAPGETGSCAMLAAARCRHGEALALAGNHAAAQPQFAAAARELAPCAARDPGTHGLPHAVAVRKAAMTLSPGRGDERIAGLQEAQRLLAALRTLVPPVPELAEELVATGTALARQLFDARQFDAADAALSAAAAELPAVGTERLRMQCELVGLRGRVQWELRRRPEAIVSMAEAVESARQWQAAQPLRLQPEATLTIALRDLAHVQNYTGDMAASAVSYRQAIGHAEAMVARFAEDPSRLVGLCAVLREFASTLVDRFRREDLDEAAALAARAITVNDRIPATVDAGRLPRWQLLTMQAVIDDARGALDAARRWRDVAAELPAEAEAIGTMRQDALAEACTGIARSLAGAGARTDATGWLRRGQEVVAANRPHLDKRAVELGWLAASLAAAAGDHAAAAAAGEAILPVRSTWFGRRRAADCVHLAWRTAGGAGADAAVVGGYRERAAQLYGEVQQELAEDVAKDPGDPFFVLPWAFAGVHRAELIAAAEPGRARELLAAAMPRLAAVREVAHRDQWDEAAIQAGASLQLRLDGGR
ncbi:MAG: serine/threonine protein kinase [Planctomycetes bacterium]|nr:serine/threonine protein kinase [Planctomycetota bacterium]